MLNHLPEKIRLVLATPRFCWKIRTGKPLQCMTAPGWTALGQMLKTDLPKRPTAKRDKLLLCHHNTAPWKTHVICCLLLSGWNKIGEDWGCFKLSYWKSFLFQGECGAGSAAGKYSQRHPTHIPAHTQGAIHNMQTPWNPKQISWKSLVLQREQGACPHTELTS